VHYPLDQPPLPRLHLLGCYHPSRQNTQTGRLTPEMIDQVFGLARSLL
jgi:uracil-DNA glycosylase